MNPYLPNRSSLPRIRWLVIMTGLLFVSSCEDIMNISFTGDASKNLVVEGSITTDTMPHKVLLSYRGDYFEKKDKEMVHGAEVSITDGVNVFMLTESTAGEYSTDTNVYGVVGKTYTLHVKLPDGREYSASDYLHSCPAFDSVRQSGNYNTYTQGYGWDVLFYGREPEPAGDHYLYWLYLDRKLYTDTITEVSVATDEFVNGNYISDFAVFRIREPDLKPKFTRVTLVMFSISKEYYDFVTSLMVETVWRGSPWDGPPANVPGNVNNGGSGFFRASDVKRAFQDFIPTERLN